MGSFGEIKNIYIEGCEFHGIPDFETDIEAYAEYIRDEIRNKITLNNSGTFTAAVRFNSITFYKLIGVWDWVKNYCPNRRIVHLMLHGKNYRIRRKNFWRGLHILLTLLEGEKQL